MPNTYEGLNQLNCGPLMSTVLPSLVFFGPAIQRLLAMGRSHGCATPRRAASTSLREASNSGETGARRANESSPFATAPTGAAAACARPLVRGTVVGAS